MLCGYVLKSVRVSKAEVSLKKKSVTVWFDANETNEKRIRSAIRNAGYLVGDVYPKA